MPTNLPYDEKELLSRIASGDTVAYRVFFNVYWRRIYASSRHFMKDPELAKDLAQDVFIKIWVNRKKLAELKSLEAYLYIVARNLFLDSLRKKMVDVPVSDLQGLWGEPQADTTGDNVEYKELQRSLYEAIEQLPPQMRTVFRLSRMEGLTHEQIATKMRISKATSQSYIVRALAIIRKSISKKAGIGDLLILLAEASLF